MGAFAIVGVIWWGSHAVLAGTRTPGVFTAFIAAMLLLYHPFKSLTRTNNNIQAGVAAAERVFEMMDEPTEVPDPPDGLGLAPGNHAVALKNVGFRYGDEWVLRDVNLEIGAGQVVALVGMSGGGKSTIADLIPRFYDVQEGAVTVDEVDVRRLSTRLTARPDRPRHAAYFPFQRQRPRKYRLRQHGEKPRRNYRGGAPRQCA